MVKYFTIDSNKIAWFGNKLEKQGRATEGYYLAVIKNGNANIKKIKKFDNDQKNSALKALQLSKRFPDLNTIFCKHEGYQKDKRDVLRICSVIKAKPISKPFVGEHAARIEPPSKFDEFRRRKGAGGRGIDFIFGIRTVEGKRVSSIQTIRFDDKVFTAPQARAWLKQHDFKAILFEPSVKQPVEKQFKNFSRMLQIERSKAIDRREKITRRFLKALGRLVLKNLKNVTVVREIRKAVALKKGIAEEAFVGHEPILNAYIDEIIASGQREMGTFAELGFRQISGEALTNELKDTIIAGGIEQIRKNARLDTASVFKTVRRIVTNSIQGATLKEGVSFTDVITKIKARVNTTSTLRGRVIATTEMNDIANFGALEGALKGGSTHKQWVWSQVERDQHAAIDGNVVPIDEPWISGDGNQLQWPGDPGQPASERINCTCSFVPLQLSSEEVQELGLSKSQDQDDFKREFTIVKMNLDKGLVFGVIYEPDVIDAHGDFADAEEIEEAAHDFMIDLMNSKQSGLNFMHKDGLTTKDAVIVETFILQNAMNFGHQLVSKGSWMLGVKVLNSQLKQLIKDKKINGFSMEGSANAER